MQMPHTDILELSSANKHIEYRTQDAVYARIQARLVKGTPWGNAILVFYGAVTEDGQIFNEIDGTIRLSGEGLSGLLNVSGICRMRVMVFSASSTVGALAEICVNFHNPNYR